MRPLGVWLNCASHTRAVGQHSVDFDLCTATAAHWLTAERWTFDGSLELSAAHPQHTGSDGLLNAVSFIRNSFSLSVVFGHAQTPVHLMLKHTAPVLVSALVSMNRNRCLPPAEKYPLPAGVASLELFGTSGEMVLGDPRK